MIAASALSPKDCRPKSDMLKICLVGLVWVGFEVKEVVGLFAIVFDQRRKKKRQWIDLFLGDGNGVLIYIFRVTVEPSRVGEGWRGVGRGDRSRTSNVEVHRIYLCFSSHLV